MQGRPWMPPVTEQDIEELKAAQERANNLNDAPANYGRQVVMVTAAQGGGVVVRDTQLISARVNAPRQWMVTLAQVQRANQPTPWAQDFDGTPYDNTKQFGGPVIPQLSGGGVPLGLLQTRIQWGAGGVRYTAAFDYPLAGGTFALTADTVDLDVTLRSQGAQTPIAAAQVPIVGAFMVEGRPADPSPLRWLESPVTVAVASGAAWTVKPFSRRLHVVSPNATKAIFAWDIVSGAPGVTAIVKQGTLIEAIAGGGIDTVLDVPAQAEIFGVTVLAGANPSLFSLEWQLGLS